MRAFIIFTACVFLAVENIVSSPICDKTAFDRNKIVSDVTSCAPRCKLQVEYPNHVHVKLGNMMSPTEAADPPSISFVADDLTYYTLLMVDPDAPILSATNRSQITHWIVGNIPGDDLKVASGETIADYIGPRPPAGDIAHRYVFLVYSQQGYIQFNVTRVNVTDRQERFVPISVFVEKYELGCPTYGNFFLSQNTIDTV